MGGLGDAANKVIAFVTFGDPIDIWSDTVTYPDVPSNIQQFSYCETSTPDPLCTNPIDSFPSDPVGFVQKLKEIWSDVDQTHMDDDQRAALGSLITELPSQATGELSQLGHDIISGHIRRWMLTPEHFWYGIDGTVSQASDDILSLL